MGSDIYTVFGYKCLLRVATVREKVWKIKNFPGQGKIREFGFSQGNWQNIGKSQRISKLRCPYSSLLNFQKLINLLNIVFIVLLNDIYILEFLYIPDCLTKMLWYFKFQAGFEKKTEEYASCSVINEIKGLSWNFWWLRATVENVWKKVKSQGKVMEMSGNSEIENEWQPCYWKVQSILVSIGTCCNSVHMGVPAVLEISILKYQLALVTVSRTWPWSTYSVLQGVLEEVTRTTWHLEGLNSISHSIPMPEVSPSL